MFKKLRITGVGGQGVFTAGFILGNAVSVYDEKQSVFTQSYGREEGTYPAWWMLMTQDERKLRINEIRRLARHRRENIDKYRLWTDDYTNLFQYLRR